MKMATAAVVAAAVAAAASAAVVGVEQIEFSATSRKKDFASVFHETL